MKEVPFSRGLGLAFLCLFTPVFSASAQAHKSESPWKFVARETYSCSLYYGPAEQTNFSVSVSRLGMSFGLSFWESGAWYQGKKWFSRKNRIYVRRLEFERETDDAERYLSTFSVRSSSMKGPEKEYYTATLSLSSVPPDFKREGGQMRMTEGESDFLRRLATHSHVNIIAQDREERTFEYRLALPDGMAGEIERMRACADTFPEQGDK